MDFGILGKGSFGSKIKEKVEQEGTVLWVADSAMDHTLLELPDWVFIATPNIYHYEHAKYFLEKKVNVFLEKPAVLNADALKELVDLSKKNNVLLYISDVYTYKIETASEAIITNNFKWSKQPNNDMSSLLDRFTYHHLSIIYYL